MTLKASVVQGDSQRLQSLTLGGLATGHVSRVEDFGLFVDLSKTLRRAPRAAGLGPRVARMLSGGRLCSRRCHTGRSSAPCPAGVALQSGQPRGARRALVPSLHMEPGSRQPKKGDKVVGRVLELDPARGRVKLTLRKALVSSKLAVLASGKARQLQAVPARLSGAPSPRAAAGADAGCWAAGLLMGCVSLFAGGSPRQPRAWRGDRRAGVRHLCGLLQRLQRPGPPG